MQEEVAVAEVPIAMAGVAGIPSCGMDPRGAARGWLLVPTASLALMQTPQAEDGPAEVAAAARLAEPAGLALMVMALQAALPAARAGRAAMGSTY